MTSCPSAYRKVPGKVQERSRKRVDDVLPLRQRRKVGDVLGDGLAGDGHAVAMQQALLQDMGSRNSQP